MSRPPRRIGPSRQLARAGVPALLGLTLAGQIGTAHPESTPDRSPVPFRDRLADGAACSFCPEMRFLPPGRFMLGSIPGEGHNDEHGPDAIPVAVDVRHPLSVSVGEVTRAEFAAFAAARPEEVSSAECVGLVDGRLRKDAGLRWDAPGFAQADDHPVVCVDWETARAYARWLSERTGHRYRLLTEAEWEYAARGGTFTRFWWGEHMRPLHANCRDVECADEWPHTAPIDALPRNGFGLANTVGNVWEWVADCYVNDAYRRWPQPYPAAVPERPGCNRVIRGGSWQDGDWTMRSANREGWRPDVPLNDVGFRVARVGAAIPL